MADDWFSKYEVKPETEQPEQSVGANPAALLSKIDPMLEWKRQNEAKNSFLHEDTARRVKEYGQYQQLGNSAAEQIQNLDLMKETLNDNSMYTGTGDQKVLDWKKFLTSVGKNPEDRAAPAEVFKKLMAGGVLEGLGQFKGLGQIRVAEIEQLQKSLADTNMTKPAIMAVLNLNQKAHERHVEIANEASTYAATHSNMLDSGWDRHLREWKKEHPFMTKDQIKNWKEEFAGRPITLEGKVTSSVKEGYQDMGNGVHMKKPVGVP